MIARILFLAAVLLLAGLAGWLLGGWPGALTGVVLGSLLALGVDSRRGLRFNHWLAAPDAARPPAVRGLWGEAAYRVSKALRAEQRKAQESAQRMDAVLAAIQASPNGVVLLDADGRMEWFNHTAAQHFGFQSQRDLLQHVVNLVREPAFVNYFNAGDFGQPVQMLGRPLAGSQPARLSVQIHPYGEGRKLLLSNDVTATARAEAMRRDFVANVSHEIRTPLTVLAGFVETMQTLPLGEQERESYLQLMAAQARRMQTLVDDLLTLSRLEGSPLPGDAERVDLVAMMRHLRDKFASAPMGRAVPELVAAAARHEGLRRIHRRFIAERRSSGIARLRSAVDSGELAGSADAEMMMDQLTGVVFQRSFISGGDLSDSVLDRLVRSVLAGHRDIPRGSRSP